MGSDVICQLPDEILISIISLISTKEAIRTSILSKRWRNISRFLPELSCIHKCASLPDTCNSEAFINAVNGVLRRHSACIYYLHFHSCLPESASMAFEQFILSLSDLFIQGLKICVRNTPDAKFQFSSHLLSLMPSLQYLKLSYGVVLQPSLKNQCNSLKEIKLYFVSISPGSLECILSNCLSLWKLTLNLCSVPSTLCFPRFDLQLKCFVIRRCKGFKEICFYAPELEIFDLECHTPVNLKFDYVPQLHLVRLKSQREDVPYFCERLGKNLSSLNTLILDSIGDPYKDVSIAKGSNMFNNLKRLELSVCNVVYNPFSVIQVMHGCPRLEEFQLATLVDKYIEWPEEGKQVIVHSRLKAVDISGFVGSENEFAFIFYLVKSAVELQRMVISWCINRRRDLGFHGKWEISYFRPPLHGEREWGHVCESIQQMKHEAVSKALQVVAREFPQTKPIKF